MPTESEYEAYKAPPRPEKPKNRLSNEENATLTRMVKNKRPGWQAAAQALAADEEVVSQYRADLIEWQAECQRRRENFKAYALDYAELTHHPNRDAAFEKAWEDSHSDGYDAVLIDLTELADLMIVR